MFGAFAAAFSTFLSPHEMVEVLTASLDARHAHTRGHSDRVAEITLSIARELRLPRDEEQLVHIAGHLHDIGKIGIPDHILLKPDRLTADEYNMIKLHPQIGYEILVKVRMLKSVAHIVLHHHERWDGRGYPAGLSGENIPLASRIIAVADAYDAMTSMRPYRSSLDHGEAVHEIECCYGSQFDPQVVDAFVRLYCNLCVQKC
jgi:putative nucleotidyltransferase with HDIG domain